MLTSSEPSPDTIQQEALDRLKGKENPFESLVRPQKGDTRFRDLDVPGLLHEQRQLLLEIIDSYRVPQYTSASDLRPTGVVIVRGARGAGKTHLLRSLQYRQDGKSQILVSPPYLGTNLSPEEFLYSELVRVLLAEDEVYNGKPFEDIACALTRRLLRQSVLGLSATDRIFATSPGRWKKLALLWGGGEPLARRFNDLARELAEPSSAHDLRSLASKQGLSPEQALRLVEGHLHRHETGTDPIVSIRRKLYSTMARLALLQDEEAVGDFLEKEYGKSDTEASLRFKHVADLLHLLTEACALERFPVVFAFDNLEGLLSPQNRFDGALTRAFMNSLAQAVDRTRGLLLLLFVEHGLLDSQITPHTDSFAWDRLRIGVPLQGRGPVEMIDIKPPSAEEITLLIKARIKDRLLGDLPGSEKLPDYFPYSEKSIKNVMGAGTASLRVVMQLLRDEFTRVVYQRQPFPEPAAGLEETTSGRWESLLATLWKAVAGSADARLKGSLVSQAQALHAGLAAMLQQGKPLILGEWTLAEVQSGVAVGDHTNYGVVTFLGWHQENPPSANGTVSACRVGVGFLLAGGPGMAPDLQAKFDLFRTRPPRADRLIVLWPKAKDVIAPAGTLPTATKKVWDESPYKGRTDLKKPAWDDMCAMLAFPDWLAQVADASNGQVPAEAIRDFVRSRCESIFQLIQPPQASRTERTAADED